MGKLILTPILMYAKKSVRESCEDEYSKAVDTEDLTSQHCQKIDCSRHLLLFSYINTREGLSRPGHLIWSFDWLLNFALFWSNPWKRFIASCKPTH